MSAKKLSDEDKALWRSVTERVEPIRDTYDFTPSVTAKLKAGTYKPKRDPIKQFLIGEKTKQPWSPPSGLRTPKDVTPHMDKKNFQRLVRGKLEIDGKLDLHGMTQEQAKIALRSKILQAHSSGKRLILVVTGKGKHRVDEFNRNVIGVLRQNVPQWLRQLPLSAVVLEVTQAQQRHGGDGAFYVYLRRNR